MFHKLEQKWKKALIAIFLGLELFIYLFCIFENFEWFYYDLGFYTSSNFIMYANTLFCFTFCILLLNGTERNLLTVFALFFTVIADYFLIYNIWYSGTYLFGVMAFVFVQLFFLLRLFKNMDRHAKIINLIIRGALLLIGEIITIIIFWGEFSLLYFVTIFYFVNLAVNVLTALLQFKTNCTFAVGLVCFIICDIFVGLRFIGAWSGFDIAWLFYLPSLVLIVLSLLHKPSEGESKTILRETYKGG